MSDINLADVTVHIDENLDQESREGIQEAVRGLDGVVAAASHDQRPHLMIVEYDPEKVGSDAILARVKEQGIHAELIGL